MRKKLKPIMLLAGLIASMILNIFSWATDYAPTLPLIFLIISFAIVVVFVKSFFSGEEEYYKDQMRKIYENSKDLS